MSLIPLNPPCIMQEYGCADITPSGSGGREGEKIWEGRCAGFMVHSWPHVEQTLEIIDKERQETMQVIPVPGKPIHFGTIRTVELRTTFHVGLLVSWRTVLEAFIDPIYVIAGMSAHGNAQWRPISRNQAVAVAAEFVSEFYAWSDGQVRIADNYTGGIWTMRILAICAGGAGFQLQGMSWNFVNNDERDLPHARVTAGRLYRLRVAHDDAVNPQSFSLDLGITKDPIDQT